MAERAAIDDAVDGVPPDPRLQVGGNAVFCVRCAADVTPLPAAARFCNRCGASLPDRRETRGRVPADAAPAGGVDPAAPASAPFQPPLILLAYAKAMFNLGHRYETAVGSRRNLEEAARCYWKAARLGDLAARDRCAADPTGPALLAYLRPPGPGSGALPGESPPLASVHRPAAS